MNTVSWLVGFGVLGSSFLGSWHCAAMCGPVASLMSRKGSLLSYHLGRGLSYTACGFAGGYLGSFFLKSDIYPLRLASGLLFGLFLLVRGIEVLKGKSFLPTLKTPFSKSLFAPESSGFALGLLTIFLPCGWLYTYIFAAAATQSALSGAFLMFLFWLAGLPALGAVSIVVKKSISISPPRRQLIAGLLLVFVSFYSLYGLFLAQVSGGHCH